MTDGHSIEHVIVLMLENRSFDHMLGFLPYGGKLTGREFNLVNPADPNSERVFVNNQAGYVSEINPPHDLPDVNTQLFGAGDTSTDPAPMNGFVKSCLVPAGGDVKTGKAIMDCFDPAKLPTLSALAQEFCLCDRWFSSVPGPTWPNRLYVHAATSDGKAANDVAHPYNMRTVYDNLAAQGLSWGIYFGDFPMTLALRRLWGHLDRFKPFRIFQEEVTSGTLPNYAFIEPRYFDYLAWKANDYHPPHDVRYGEDLVADVYATLRASKLWEKSLFIVLFDEHGGFYDRFSPPRPVPNPDNQNSQNPPFDFTRLGVRVPAVLVSPLIERGRVDSTGYEHASIPATVKKLFGLPAFLTARDAAATAFESVLSLSTPRDTPMTLPPPRWPVGAQDQRALLHVEASESTARATGLPQTRSQAPLSEFQETLVQLADIIGAGRLAEMALPPISIRTEHVAAEHVQDRLSSLLER
jgi:phospholipase C